MGCWSIDRGDEGADEEHPRYRTGGPAWWFTSRSTGRITVAQVPNVPLLVFLVAEVAAWLLDGHHPAARIMADVATGAIVVWALDEVIRGVNPWRRLLGAVVLTLSVVSAVRR